MSTEYNKIYRLTKPEGRQRTRCRRVSLETGGIIEIEFEDGARLKVSRFAVKEIKNKA